MAENNAQEMNGAQLFVLSENARTILANFEERLKKEGLSDEQQKDVRIELIAKLTALNFPESIEHYAIKARSDNKECERIGMVAVSCLEWIDDMRELQTNSHDADLHSFIASDAIAELCKEYPAVIDYFYRNEPKQIVERLKSRDDFHLLIYGLAPFEEEMGVWDDDVVKPRNTDHVIYWEVPCFVKSPVNTVASCLYKIRRKVGLLNFFRETSELPLSAFDRAVLVDSNSSQWTGEPSCPSEICLLGKELGLTEFVDKYMNDQGVLFYLVPKEANFELDVWQKCRQSLIDSRRLYAVIDLPTQKACNDCNTLWVIKKGMGLDKVIFVDACRDASGDNSSIDYQKVLNKMNEENPSCYCEVQYEDLNVNDFMAAYYCSCPVPKEGEKLVALRDLVDLYDTEIEDEATGFFILRAHYTSDIDDCLISYDMADQKRLEAMRFAPARRVPLVNNLCMTRANLDYDWSITEFEVARIGDINEVLVSGRSTFPDEELFDTKCEYEDRDPIRGLYPKIYTYGDAFIFRNKWNDSHPRSGLSTDYLLMALTSEDVLEQLDGKRTLTKDEFLSLQIVVPSFEEQNRRLAEYRKKKRGEDLRTIKESLQSYKDDVRMKKHALAQNLRVMKNWWQILQKARKDGAGVVDDKAVVGELHPVCVKDIYDNIDREINLLFKQVSAFNLGDQMQAEVFDANAFVREYVKHHDPMFEYDCKFLDVPANIRFPKKALQIILGNIASNACAHGFKGRENKSNVIRLSLELKGDDLILTVENNGKPMLAGMTAKRVFTYGDTTEEGADDHSGLGGFQIWDLMKRFDGKAILDLNEKADFPVSYKLCFHDVNLYK